MLNAMLQNNRAILIKVIKLAAVYKEQSCALICDEVIYIND
jgi:hypothetical protein